MLSTLSTLGVFQVFQDECESCVGLTSAVCKPLMGTFFVGVLTASWQCLTSSDLGIHNRLFNAIVQREIKLTGVTHGL